MSFLWLSILLPSCRPHQDGEEECAAYQTSQSVDGVVCLDVHRGEAEQHVEGCHDVEQTTVAGVPGEQHTHGGDAYV